MERERAGSNEPIASPLNQTSIEDLEEMRRIIVERGVFADDFECLVAKDGHVYASDPADLSPVRLGEAPHPDTLQFIDKLIELARENVQRGS